jgi:hypothetical protein
VAVVLAGEERPVCGEGVRPDQGAVQDHERVPGLLRGPHRLAQLRSVGRQQGDGLSHVALSGCRSYPEPGCHLRERLPLTQVHQDQQGLLAGVQLPPRRPDHRPVLANNPSDEGKGLVRQRQRGTVEKHGKPLVFDEEIVVIASSTRGFLIPGRRHAAPPQTATNPAQPG